MTVIQSQSSLLGLQPGWLSTSGSGSLNVYGAFPSDYWTIYRTQPNLRTVVDFLARNVAQLGLHVFRRISDTDRERLTDHGLSQLLGNPNPSTTRYRMIEQTMIDLGVWWAAYWLKIPRPGGGIALLRVPPEIVTVKGLLSPTEYRVALGGEPLKVRPEQIVHFRQGTGQGISPLETLRRILAEESAAGDYREGFWNNSARMSGIITRPAVAPEWSTAARERFRAEFEALYTGQQNSGRTAILEEGMTFEGNTFNAEDSQYIETRKLTREECARAYHVPLPMVGILDHATFSNIQEQHKNLYQDCLGPWLTMLQEDIELQLLSEFADTDGVYVEFNIAAKLAGSFEEQASSLSTLVGRPLMTANEGRARLNLPQQPGDADQLVTPLNVLVGGQASPQTPTEVPKALPSPLYPSPVYDRGSKADDQVDTTHVRLRGRHVEKWSQVISKFFDRQRSAVLGALGKSRRAGAKARIDDLFDGDRWDKDLHGDLLALATATATAFGKRVAEALDSEFDPDELAAWLDENSRIAAEGVNKLTRQKLLEALDEDDERDAIGAMFDWMRDSRAAQIAQSKVTGIANFGAHEGAKQGGLREKTWLVNSGKPRSAHRSMAGSTVKLSEDFSNGMAWPGDPKGGADELANCQCSLVFGG